MDKFAQGEFVQRIVQIARNRVKHRNEEQAIKV